jgi:molybdenum cofactor cytidylyltransferase
MIPGVVLAAGASTRMGRPKALLPVAPGGETFLERIVSTLAAASADDVVIVVAPGAEAVRRAIGRWPVLVRVVENPHPERGQLSSLQAALGVVDHPGVIGMLVWPVDVPFASVETVRTLLAVARRTRAPVVRPVRGAQHGHPVVFDRSVFDDLRRPDLAGGARHVVRAHAARVVDVEVEEDGPFLEVDTPEDYARVTGCRLSDEA